MWGMAINGNSYSKIHQSQRNGGFPSPLMDSQDARNRMRLIQDVQIEAGHAVHIHRSAFTGRSPCVQRRLPCFRFWRMCIDNGPLLVLDFGLPNPPITTTSPLTNHKNGRAWKGGIPWLNQKNRSIHPNKGNRSTKQHMFSTIVQVILPSPNSPS